MSLPVGNQFEATLLNILWKVLTAAFIIVAAYLLVRFYRVIVDRVTPRVGAIIGSRIKILGTWFIWFIAALITLSNIGLDVTILLLIFALIGIATVLATRDTLTSLFSEQVLAVQQYFKIGDWISVGDHSGRVIEMNPVSTVLLTTRSERVVIPNSFFTNHVIVNRTAEGAAQLDIRFITDRKVALPALEEELAKIGTEVAGELTRQHSPRIAIKRVGKKSMLIQLSLRIANPAREDTITTEVNRKIKELLDKLERTDN
jgi:MscS family membrane protein